MFKRPVVTVAVDLSPLLTAPVTVVSHLQVCPLYHSKSVPLSQPLLHFQDARIVKTKIFLDNLLALNNVQKPEKIFQLISNFRI